ncbi:hypothetical protein DXG03_000227 [Asterophora parasitica]|uniref:Uncharacterized protein n=1 Tax=Asterophora parasitica TaxID=117018 RepID=A0A9P7GF31_9AGAR|nr:hypothetical protein DXG03_000227 [Asterophora parasitica]
MAFDDRPTRKSKAENRIYRFITRSLTRSRSRSRTRNGHDPLDTDEPVPHLPPIHIDSMRSKPSARISSRPLSSTTTATNTTITPATPRAKKRIPVPQNNSPSASPTRPATPNASAARKKLHTLFGIPLASPKNSSFRSSTQSSPRPSLDVPAQDHDPDSDPHFKDDDPTPKAFKSYPPPPYARPESPTPSPDNTRPNLKLTPNSSTGSSATATSSSNTSNSSRLQRFFAGSQKTPPPPTTDAVSHPMVRRPSSSSRNSIRNNSNSPSPSSASASKSNIVLGSIGPPALPSPRITQFPPAPLHPATSPQIKATSSLGHSSRKGSIDSGRGSRADGFTLATTASSSGHGHARLKLAAGSAHRSTKHGSFDFERPGWSAGAGAVQIERAGSVGTARTSTSGRTGTSLGFGWRGDAAAAVRDSAMGPGIAGVGTLQREVSLKRGKEREEMIIRARDEERRRRREENRVREKLPAEKELGVLPENTVSTLTPPADENFPVTSTKTSSWGRKRGLLLGKAKIGSLGLSHGPFAFEPPVPSPTRSTGSASGHGHDTPLSVSWAGEKGRDKDRPRRVEGKERRESELERERWKQGRDQKERRSLSSHRGDRPPVPVPAPSTSSFGHRSGAKGRSLDLGLGLSWAPTTVREDALLPKSGYFGTRTASASSSLGGRSRNPSGSTIEEEREKEKSILGTQVAGVFKNALDARGYIAFRDYVHRFDAHDIPFDGPTGIVARVERLLMTAPDLSDEGKRQLLDNFVRVVLQSA